MPSAPRPDDPPPDSAGPSVDHRHAVLGWPAHAAEDIVRARRLTLRPYAEAHRDAMISLLNRNKARLRPVVPINRDGEPDAAWFDRQLELAERGRTHGDAWRRVVWTAGAERPRPIGVAHLNAISRGLEAEADLCVWIDAEQTGRGLASEAVAATLAVAFALPPRGLGLTAVHGGVQGGNPAGRRLLERCGFRLDPGKQSHLLINGSWVRHEYWVVTPPITA